MGATWKPYGRSKMPEMTKRWRSSASVGPKLIGSHLSMTFCGWLPKSEARPNPACALTLAERHREGVVARAAVGLRDGESPERRGRAEGRRQLGGVRREGRGQQP